MSSTSNSAPRPAAQLRTVPIGTFVLGGGNATSNAATGILNVTGSLILGNNADTSAGPIAKGNLTINGGTANLSTNIVRGGNATNSNATLILNGGVLNMNGNSIGTAALPIQHDHPCREHNDFADAHESSAAARASMGAGLTANGAGTLILGGTNTYTGGTIINTGSTLQVGTASLNGAAPVRWSSHQ